MRLADEAKRNGGDFFNDRPEGSAYSYANREALGLDRDSWSLTSSREKVEQEALLHEKRGQNVSVSGKIGNAQGPFASYTLSWGPDVKPMNARERQLVYDDISAKLAVDIRQHVS
ncbi:MAG: hypothetical protein KGL39_30630 [Patescibacteria group bacterium]|nr:hypothetical protein [Patescibacteria group bacterium]